MPGSVTFSTRSLEKGHPREGLLGPAGQPPIAFELRHVYLRRRRA